MLALTIWQPWASLIIAGGKKYEFRGWPAPKSVRGKQIAIHAATRKVKRDEVAEMLLRLRSDEAWTTGLDLEIAEPLLERVLLTPDILPLSSLLGECTIGAPVRANTLSQAREVNDALWAWPLSDIVAWEPFIPARGQQGFWECGQAEMFAVASSSRAVTQPGGLT